jgi:hypothetical protein
MFTYLFMERDTASTPDVIGPDVILSVFPPDLMSLEHTVDLIC